MGGYMPNKSSATVERTAEMVQIRDAAGRVDPSRPSGAVGVFEEFRDGVIAIAPLELAGTPFGLIFGAAAVTAGLSPGEAILMSATVFAGTAQFLAVSVWSHPAPWFWLGFAVLLVNLRHVLMAASIARKMERFQPWQRWLAAFVLADESWAMAERRILSRPLTPAFYAGMGLTMYIGWLSTTAVGAIAGSLVPQPELLGLDFAFPAVVICIILGFAKGWHAAPVVAASAIVALLTHRFVEGGWFVVAGGVAGMITAVVLSAPNNARDER
jgi:4-azaleucine resistance transporter AzlC